MEKENIENLNSEIENKESLNSENNEEVIQETEEKNLKQESKNDIKDSIAQIEEKNKQLFARAKKAEEELKKLKSQQQSQQSPFDEELILRKVDERLDERELNSLDLDDKIKQEIKSYAKLNNVSLSEARKSDYIQFKINKIEEEKKISEASVGDDERRTTEIDYNNIDISKIDVWTEEGRKTWEKWKKSKEIKL